MESKIYSPVGNLAERAKKFKINIICDTPAVLQPILMKFRMKTHISISNLISNRNLNVKSKIVDGGHFENQKIAIS